MELLLLLTLLGAVSGDVVACPAGLLDHTGGDAQWWDCGRKRGCPGSFPWADRHCQCACVAPHHCVAKTAEDACVTAWERSESHVAPAEGTSPAPPSSTVPSTSVTRSQPRSPPSTTSIPAAQFLPRAPATLPVQSEAPSPSVPALEIILLVVLACGVAGCAMLFCVWWFSQSDLPIQDGHKNRFAKPSNSAAQQERIRARFAAHHAVPPPPGLPTLLSSVHADNAQALPNQSGLHSAEAKGNVQAFPCMTEFSLAALPCKPSSVNPSAPPGGSSDAAQLRVVVQALEADRECLENIHEHAEEVEEKASAPRPSFTTTCAASMRASSTHLPTIHEGNIPTEKRVSSPRSQLRASLGLASGNCSV